MSGYSDQEIVGAPIGVFEATESQQETADRIKRIVRMGHDSFESRHRRKDGSIFDVDVTALYLERNGGQIAIFVRDVTDRKKVEDALRESEAKYRGLFENSDESIIVYRSLLDAQGKVVDLVFEDLNQATERALRMTRNRLVGRSFKEVFGKELMARYLPTIRRVREENRPLRYEETDNYVESLDKYFLTLYIPLDSERLIASSVDVTAIKKAQRRTEEYSKRLERSNAELEQFAYVASHDLQEPLRMVTSYLGMLEKKYLDKLDENAKEYIEFSVDGAKRMKSLIDDLLLLSRVTSQARPLEKVDMNEVVEVALQNIAGAIDDAGAEIVVDPLPSVMADESQMVQLMQNLLSNAIKFHGEERPSIHINSSTSLVETVFAVKDNGVGLSMAHADKIFRMFQRLHSSSEYPGTGVGLAIAKKIVERHGGKIWVESEPGKGATFFFSIPRSEWVDV
jgi:PAS domain S-box-containing protein